MRAATVCLVLLSAANRLSAQLAGQSFEVVPEAANVTVGDSVTIRFRVRLHERDLLIDTIPRPLDALQPGVRILSVDRLVRGPDRVYQGSARLVFYRTGRRAVPVFGLPFMRIVEGIPRATLASDSAFVEIRSILPAGDPPLKDIKEMERLPISRLLPVLGALALAAAGLVYRSARRRRRRPGPEVITSATPPLPPAPTAYETALQRLHQIAQQRWPLGGMVARHYEAVADVLRDYLEEAEQVGARERTTSELLWSLPPHLTAGGMRSRCHQLLSAADLVKFAEARPSQAGAAAFLAEARDLLDTWHAARAAEATENALR